MGVNSIPLPRKSFGGSFLHNSPLSSFPNPVAAMDTQYKFRVLIIGRANAGKTSILQRVCDTMESPVIYRQSDWEEEQGPKLDPSMNCGEHEIEDEIIFSSHDGYVFHDSHGFEEGVEEELRIVQNFVQKKSTEEQLENRLHAIWYCIPMDNQWPELELKHFKDICPDQNVPVIVVFTECDQFKWDMEMDLEDRDVNELQAMSKTQFQENYLCHLDAGAKYVRLERMHKPDGCCKSLIEETARALTQDVVNFMLVAVQKSNLELSIKLAVEHTYPYLESSMGNIVEKCLRPFPYILVGASAHSCAPADIACPPLSSCL
ncbi:hypothetical protein D9756_009633 [Leucocoprinus leucothites]|uniref:G domain-containing protein n=1 Tax=Leucocoprinus leucothites TaxID=201217 RepID=A0A8H5CVT8_9AGAR|nr:hypothetical protein D9756_009633 [Leucoagaricus leucothites]